MSEQKTLRRWRIVAMVLYFLAGFTMWFAANAWLIVGINYRAIDTVDSHIEERTGIEAREIKWESHD